MIRTHYFFSKDNIPEKPKPVEIEIELNIHGHDIGLTEIEFKEWLENGGLLYKIIIPKEESKIKCYCGHTTYCDCEPLEEHKQETLEEYIEEVTKNFKDEQSVKFTSGGIKLGVI